MNFFLFSLQLLVFYMLDPLLPNARSELVMSTSLSLVAWKAGLPLPLSCWDSCPSCSSVNIFDRGFMCVSPRVHAAFLSEHSKNSLPNSYQILGCLDRVAASCFIEACIALSSLSASYCLRCLQKCCIHSFLYCPANPSTRVGRACFSIELNFKPFVCTDFEADFERVKWIWSSRMPRSGSIKW